MFSFCSAWLSISVSCVSRDYRLRVDVFADVADVELLLDVLRLQRADFFEDLQLVVDLVGAVVVQVWSAAGTGDHFVEQVQVRHHVLLRLVHHLHLWRGRVELEASRPFVIVAGTLWFWLGEEVVAGRDGTVPLAVFRRAARPAVLPFGPLARVPALSCVYFRLFLLWCLSLVSFFSLWSFSLRSFSLRFLLFLLSSLWCDFLSFFFFFLSSLELLRLELDRLPIFFNDK